MPKPITIEVREKIVQAYNNNIGTQSYIAKIFGVTCRTVNKLINLSINNNLAPKKPTGRPPFINKEGLSILKKIVLLHPDKTLDEYSNLFKKSTGIHVSIPVMCRALKKLNLRRKKKSFYAQEQEREDVKKKR